MPALASPMASASPAAELSGAAEAAGALVDSVSAPVASGAMEIDSREQGDAAPADPPLPDAAGPAAEEAQAGAAEEQLQLAPPVSRQGELSTDLGNLLVSDPSTVPSLAALAAKGPLELDQACLDLGAAAVQQLVNELFSLPSTAIKMGRLADLPPPSTPLPREKPIPKPRPPTKWEKFAQSKGIVKRKRSKEVQEEGSGEWKRRYGYKRANDEKEIPILEAKATDEVGVDAFAERVKEKKARVKKQEKNQLANLKQAAKARGVSAPGASGMALPSSLAISAAALPLTAAAGPGLGGPGRPQQQQRRPSKGEISEAASLVRTSTASLGKFDPKLKGAKPGKRAPHSLKVLPVAEARAKKAKQSGGGAGGVERQLMQSLAETVIARNDTGDSMDVGKAVSMLNKEKDKARKGRAKGGDAFRKGDVKGGKGDAKGGKGGKRKAGEAGGRKGGEKRRKGTKGGS